MIIHTGQDNEKAFYSNSMTDDLENFIEIFKKKNCNFNSVDFLITYLHRDFTNLG